LRVRRCAFAAAQSAPLWRLERPLGYAPAMNAAALALATGFGTGFFPIAPATLASALVTLVVWFLVPVSPVMEGLVALALVPIAVWSAHQAEKRLGHDAHPIVIDEVLGQWIALWAVPRTAVWMGAGFLLFRFFDIAKPLGVNGLQRLPGGWGITADDALAGIYSRIVLALALWIVPLIAR
jgi:phosphatidylglycerophosphatase A